MHPARIAELLAPFLETPLADREQPSASPGQAEARDRTLYRNNDVQHRDNDALLRSISTYIDILLRWNARINLTAIRDPEEIVLRHFGESLFVARHLFPDATVNPAAERRKNGAHSASYGSVGQGPPDPEGRKKLAPNIEDDHGSYQGTASSGADPAPEKIGASAPEARDRPTLADLGSGAGFPGLPIKLWAPEISLTLIESNHKKTTFLREVTRILTLTNVNILNARAEQLAQATTGAAQTFDVVTLRAVERLEEVLQIAVKLVAPGGRLTLLIGASQLNQVRSALPSLDWDEPISVPLSKSRTILVGTRSDPFAN